MKGKKSTLKDLIIERKACLRGSEVIGEVSVLI